MSYSAVHLTGLSRYGTLMKWHMWRHCKYSRASDNGPSEKRTTSLQRTSAVLPIEFSIVIVH